jgi:hypothetical protein
MKLGSSPLIFVKSSDPLQPPGGQQLIHEQLRVNVDLLMTTFFTDLLD